jgi:hypothetical protein
MRTHRKQFTIGSLMILIAIVGLCLAYPAILLFLMVPLAFVALSFLILFFFLIFLAAPLILLDWLESADLWFERRKLLRSSPVVVADPSLTRDLPRVA